MLEFLYVDTGIRANLIILPIVMSLSMIFRAYKKGELMKNLNQVLDGTMGDFTGVFLGHAILEMWRYKSRPELYAMQSAPWYTSILVYGAFTVAVLAICMVIKAIWKYYTKKSVGNE